MTSPITAKASRLSVPMTRGGDHQLGARGVLTRVHPDEAAESQEGSLRDRLALELLDRP